MSNHTRNVFYVGITGNLVRRVREHKQGVGGRFTFKYKCFDLIYYEDFHEVINAIAREKQLKKWKRNWKIRLIQKENPDLKDLSSAWD